MAQIDITFQAYLPNSVGKPLAQYFAGKSVVNNFVNTDEFMRALRRLDNRGYKWIPQPNTFFFGYYTTTDNVSVNHRHNGDHTAKLQTELTIDTNLIGTYGARDVRFGHKAHQGGAVVGNQHSDLSTRVRISKVPVDAIRSRPYGGVYATRYRGVVGTIQTRRSEEIPQPVDVVNSQEHPTMSAYGSRSNTNDTTTITVSASAPYPFLPSPAIDYTVVIKVTMRGDTVFLNVSGSHNEFPAYEMMVNGSRVYHYNPSVNGHTGPTPIGFWRSDPISYSSMIPLPAGSNDLWRRSRERRSNFFFRQRP